MEKSRNIIRHIKSNFILKKIFSLICEIRKLDVILYNKMLQNSLNINNENYDKYRWKYKIGEKNGIGEEYDLDSNSLLFEGEYLNGKKNGKGKEYYKEGKLKFEGEYSNGNKIKGKKYDKNGNVILTLEENGKGKELYENGILKFGGDYFDGRRWHGKGYNNDGEFDFEIKYGKGSVIEYNYKGILIFEGEYINGKKN